MIRKYITPILIILFSIGIASGASVTLRIEPPRGKNSIGVGDTFYLSIKVSNTNDVPSQPDVPGTKTAYYIKTSEESSFANINGQTSQNISATYTATLIAENEGTFTYGPISVGGVRSNQVKFTIGSQSAPSQAQQGPSVNYDNVDDYSKPKSIDMGDSNLFMRASVSETTAYEQQALLYTVKLYSSYANIKFIGATASPKFDGFVVEESKDVSNNLAYETLNGKRYVTAIIARYIIFPQMTGNLRIKGNTYTVSVDRREYFHDSFWGNMSYTTPLQLNVTPNDLVINVKPLPQPKPADFSGGVGKFSISSELKTKSFKTNEVGTIVYKVQGTGNLKYIQLPDLSLIYPTEIDVFSNNSNLDVNIGANNVSGSITYDYSIMPLEEGKFHIPEVKLVYFNPQTGTYETAVAQGFDIEVGKGSASSQNTRRLRFDSKLQNIDPTKLIKEYYPIVLTFKYWLWYIIPIIVLIASFIFYRRYVTTHADMVSLNSRRADKIARRRLRKAAKAIRKNNAEQFYTELLKALWGYMSDKLKMPTSELMRDNIRTVMASRNISDEQIDMFIRIIDDAEFAKYSSAGGKENLNKVYDEAAETINSLEKAFKK